MQSRPFPCLLLLAILFGISQLLGCSKSHPDETLVSAVSESTPSARSAHPSKDSETVTYAHFPTGNLNLDITKPEAGKSLHRGILLIHGGGWVGGSRQEMTEIAAFLAAKGFLTATVDYRLVRTALWPAQLDDVQTAVRYLRHHAKDLDISPDKIGAAGISAGGHLSLFLGTSDTRRAGEYPEVSSRVQAVGSISGIHDLNAPLTPEGETYGIVQALLGEHGTVDRKSRSQASPQTYLNAKTAPTLFIQGNQDPLVPLGQSLITEEKLKSLGVPTDLVKVEGMKHGLSPHPAPEIAALERLAIWMAKYLA